MNDERNTSQITRKDARGCFVESLNDAFAINKAHLVFAAYDVNRPAGERQTNYVSIYIDMDEFLDLCRQLESEGKRWRFVARYEDGQAEVALREISESHPFYRLEGSNNIVLLTTERYREYPMLIQGYGAGASVTAAGVFADIMSIANI